ncbi:MAG: nucleoside phosphorylase [Lachnospiraceae bacterium]|nr:nucleoside phosphorylase [Lachnospiraceae bacterium]
MALIKNEIPIMEYDTEKTAVLMPGHSWDYQFAKRAVLLFMEEEIDDYVRSHHCKIVGRFESITKAFLVYETEIDDQRVSFVQAPLGGAGAVQVMEQMIAGGAKKLIAAGCCGALESDMEGDLFIPTAALRQEGTSYHYLPPSREVELSKEAIDAIEKILKKRKLPYRKCKSWTTDGFYRETKEMVLYRKSEGYSVVEMECASMAACAKMRNVIFGQLLFTADSLANVEKHDCRNEGKDFFSTALELALLAALEL